MKFITKRKTTKAKAVERQWRKTIGPKPFKVWQPAARRLEGIIMKNNLSRKLFAVIMALCVVFAYTGFAFADTVEEMTTPGTEAEVTEPVVEEEPVEGTEEPVIEIEEEKEETEEEVTEEEPVQVPEPKAKKIKAANDAPELKLPTAQYIANVDGKDVVLYCMQHQYAWPDENGIYVECDLEEQLSAIAGEDGLSEEEYTKLINTVKKILFAGYPYNSVGILDDLLLYEDDSPISMTVWAHEFTNRAIWYTLVEYGITGNADVPAYVAPTDPEYMDYVDQLMAYGNSDAEINPPSTDKVSISGSGLLTKKDGLWTTEALTIEEPARYVLNYSFTVPEGVKVVDANGNELTLIKQGEDFYITADSEDAVKDLSKIEITAEVEYPTELICYKPLNRKTADSEDLGGSLNNNYQTMLGVGIASMTLTGELALSIKPETPVIPTPGGNITPPSPTPDDEDSKVDDTTEETPVTPEEPSADEEDDDSIDSDPMGDFELMSDSDDEDAEADEAEEDISADPMGVKTGDATDMLIYLAFFLISVLMLCGCIAYTKKIRKE